MYLLNVEHWQKAYGPMGSTLEMMNFKLSDTLADQLIYYPLFPDFCLIPVAQSRKCYFARKKYIRETKNCIKRRITKSIRAASRFNSLGVATFIHIRTLRSHNILATTYCRLFIESWILDSMVCTGQTWTNEGGLYPR